MSSEPIGAHRSLPLADIVLGPNSLGWQTPPLHTPPVQVVPSGKLVKGLQVRVALLQPPPVWHADGTGQAVGQFGGGAVSTQRQWQHAVHDSWSRAPVTATNSEVTHHFVDGVSNSHYPIVPQCIL